MQRQLSTQQIVEGVIYLESECNATKVQFGGMWNAKLCRLNGRRLNVHFTLCTQKISTLYSENLDSELN